MKIPCAVIKDLLPLYHDGVCNEDSRAIVEEHLTECESCTKVLEKIKNSTVDDYLKQEREDVVLHHTRAVKRHSLIVGICIAAVMAIPVLVSLIVNLVTGHSLDWFFIVITSLMILASVTVVPLIVEKEKGLWTLGAFTVSIILLLLTCAIYSGGDWFIVAAVPVLFSLSVMFTPYVMYRLPLNNSLAEHKGLLAMTIDTVLLFAIIISAGFYMQDSTLLEYWRPAFTLTTIHLLLPWGLFLIIRYLKANGLIKAGLCIIFSGIFLSLIENIAFLIIDGAFRFQFRNANLSVWNDDSVINANIYLIFLLTGVIVGGILLIIGLLKKRYSKTQ